VPFAFYSSGSFWFWTNKVLKSFHPFIYYSQALNSLFGNCSFMSLIFYVQIKSIKVFLCMINKLPLLVETLAGFKFAPILQLEKQA
jgi:hypothetical protein